MFTDYTELAFRNIRKRGIRSWLTMLGIFIGIAAVVSLISLGDGLKNAITGQFSTLGADKLVITNSETGFGPPGASSVSKLTDHDLEIIERVPGVKIAVKRIIRVGKFEYNQKINYQYMTNVPNDIEKMKVIYSALNVKPESGRLLTPQDRGKVVLGNSFTNKDGDFEKPIKVGNTVKIQDREFQVVGILEKASSFTINQVVFMPEDDIKDVLNISDEADAIVAQLSNKDLADQVSTDISKRLRQDRKEKVGEEDFNVQTPQQSLQSINTVLDMINLVVAGIAAISLIVGGIGITNTMYTSVLERTKEIGVMKAVGAKNKEILSIFLIESSFLGLVGGLVGSFIGLTFAFLSSLAIKGIFPAIPFNVTISIPLLATAILFALFVGTLAGLIPAYQASKLKPVEALRS